MYDMRGEAQSRVTPMSWNGGWLGGREKVQKKAPV